MMREAEQNIGGACEDAELLRVLTRAAADLLMRSESDYPFVVVNFGNIDEDALNARLRLLVISQTDAANGEPILVEITTLEHFFRVAVKAADWHDAAESERTRRFQILVELLKRSFRRTRVYRVGARDIAVFIVGQSTSGAWLGLRTRVIET